MGKKRAVPIVSSAYSDDCAPWTIQDLCNWLPVNAEATGTRSNEIAITVPGLQEYATVPDATRQRGGYVAEGRLFAVVDTTLYQVMPDGSLRTKGTIPGRGRCSFAHNGVTELLIVNGSAGYIYDWTADTLTQITDASFSGAVFAAYISNLFLIVDPTRRFAQNSALNNGLEWNATETFQGESKPDQIVGHTVANGEYILFGERSLDHFQYTGVVNSLFQNKQIPVDRGCGSGHSICNLDNAVFFIGNDGSGYEKRNYDPLRITTHAIEQAWSEHDLSKAYAFVWEDKGHKVWYVTFPDGGHTWGFDLATRKWHRRQSSGMNRWRLAWLQPWNGAWYGGEYNSGRIFRLDWDYHLEGADRITRLCISGVAHDNQNRLTLNEFEPVVEAVGEATTATSVFTLIFDDTQETVEGLTLGGSLPDAAVGDTVNFQYATIGGVGEKTFAVTSGSLPAGVTMTTGGLITGTYTTAEHDNAWTVTATDEVGTTAAKVEAQYVLDMLGTPPSGTSGVAYSYALTGSEGTAPYTFALASGALNAGLALATDGTIAGTPSTVDTSTFSVTITDAAGVVQTKPYNIGVSISSSGITLILYNEHYSGPASALVEEASTVPTLTGVQGASSRYGRVIAGKDGSNTLKIWRWSGSAYVLMTITGNTPGASGSSFKRCAVSNNGDFVVVPGSANQKVYVYQDDGDGVGFTLVTELDYGGIAPTGVCFSPDETEIATTGSDGVRTYLFDGTSGALAVSHAAVSGVGDEVDWVGNYIFQSVTSGGSAGRIRNATTLATICQTSDTNIGHGYFGVNADYVYWQTASGIRTATFNGFLTSNVGLYAPVNGYNGCTILDKERTAIIVGSSSGSATEYLISGTTFTEETNSFSLPTNIEGCWTGAP